MKEVNPSWTLTVVVCANERSPESGRRSCGKAAGRELRYWLRDRAREEGIRDAMVVHAGGCMDVCGLGTTVTLLGPSVRRVWITGSQDREALWDEVVGLIG